MLRLLVLLLVVANLGYWAWSQAPWRARLTGETPPVDRSARQVRPDAVRLIGPPGPASGVAAAASGGDPADAAGSAAPQAEPGLLGCLETESLDPSGLAAAQRQLQLAGVAPGGWLEMRRELPGEWMLYMGPFPDRNALERKLAELQPLQVRPTRVAHAGSPWGLQLGVFDSAASAQARLAELQGRGVRTARVLMLRAPTAELRLRADRISAAALGQLLAAASAPSAADALSWRTCP